MTTYKKRGTSLAGGPEERTDVILLSTRGFVQ